MADWGLDEITIIRHNVIQRLLPTCIDDGPSAIWRTVLMSRSKHRVSAYSVFINAHVFLCIRGFKVSWDECIHETVSNAFLQLAHTARAIEQVRRCLDHKGNAVSPEHLLLAYTNNGCRWRQAKIKASEPAAYALHARIKKGDRGAGPSLENHKAIGLLNNTDPDPLKITKLPS